MFKNILVAVLLLAPVLAYGGSPSTDLSVQIVPAASTKPPPPLPPPSSNGIACDVGPNYTSSIPAAAQAAGYTHCAANYDFTNAAYSNMATWLDCKGASPYQWSFAYGNCAHVFMATDGGSQVLDLEWQPSDYGQYTSTSIQTTGPNNDGNPADFVFSTPAGKYIEVTARMSSASASVCPNPCILSDAWAWQGGGAGIEWDFIEIYGPTSNVGTSGGGFGGWNGISANHSGLWNVGHLSGYDPTVYHTYGVRAATDGAGPTGTQSIAWCLYLDGTMINQQSGGSTYQCASGGWSPANTAIDRDALILTVGPQGSSANYTGNADFYVQSFRVWECPGYATGECNVLTSEVTNGGALLGSP